MFAFNTKLAMPLKLSSFDYKPITLIAPPLFFFSLPISFSFPHTHFTLFISEFYYFFSLLLSLLFFRRVFFFSPLHTHTSNTISSNCRSFDVTLTLANHFPFSANGYRLQTLLSSSLKSFTSVLFFPIFFLSSIPLQVDIYHLLI